MRIKLFTKNIDIATVAAGGGLTVMPMFPLFMEQHGLHYSIVALVITLWGFVSLKQIDTKQGTPKPKNQRWRKMGITIALIILIGGGLLFSAIKMIDVTQTATPACPEPISPDCSKKWPSPPCLLPEWSCPLDTAEQRDNLNSIGSTP